MTVKEAREKNITLVLPDGTPLIKRELDFIELMETIEEEYGSTVVLAFKVIIEAIINKAKKE